MPTIVAQLRQDMRECAVELRKLAYTMPNGVGEHDLLLLSEEMITASGQEPLAMEAASEQEGRTIEDIRAVIPEWPETNGTPWQMCAICHGVYDPTSSNPHDDPGSASSAGKRSGSTAASSGSRQIDELLDERLIPATLDTGLVFMRRRQMPDGGNVRLAFDRLRQTSSSCRRASRSSCARLRIVNGAVRQYVKALLFDDEVGVSARSDRH